jgi:hypothetical protein
MFSSCSAGNLSFSAIGISNIQINDCLDEIASISRSVELHDIKATIAREKISEVEPVNIESVISEILNKSQKEHPCAD